MALASGGMVLRHVGGELRAATRLTAPSVNWKYAKEQSPLSGITKTYVNGGNPRGLVKGTESTHLTRYRRWPSPYVTDHFGP
jgi:hypothetical protein